MFKMFGSKDKHEPEEEKQDDLYRIPALNSVPVSMSPELMRRKKEEYLKKRYSITGLKDRI